MFKKRMGLSDLAANAPAGYAPAEEQETEDLALLEGRPLRRAQRRRRRAPVVRFLRAHGRALMALALVLCLGAGTYLFTQHVTHMAVPVTITDRDTVIGVQTNQQTVEGLLEKQGIAVSRWDVVSPGRDTPVAANMSIQVHRSMAVNLKGDDSEFQVHVLGGTVADALDAAGLKLNPEDEVSPSADTPVEPGMVITLARVTSERLVKYESIPYSEVTKEDPELLEGERRVTEGVDGQKKKVIRVVYRDGEEIGRSVVEETVTRQAVNRVIYVGTKPKPTPTPEPTKRPSSGSAKPSGGGSASSGSSSGGGSSSSGSSSGGGSSSSGSSSGSGSVEASGSTITIGGTTYSVVSSFTSRCTAYTHTGNQTYTGTWPKVGTLAVDPSVIPLGSLIYVDGYGLGRAEDTGYGINGTNIDLFMETYNQCINWGMQQRKVYILSAP